MQGQRSKILLSYTPAMIAAIVAVIFTFGYYNSKNSNTPQLGNYALIRVLNRVEGSDQPALKAGEMLSLQAEICVLGKETIPVDVKVGFYRLVDTNQIPVYEAPLTLQLKREPGCKVIETKIRTPANLQPGSYVFKGTDTVIKTGQIVSWTTEPFRIIQ